MMELYVQFFFSGNNISCITFFDFDYDNDNFHTLNDAKNKLCTTFRHRQLVLNPFRCLCKDTSKILRHKQIHSKPLGGGWSQNHQN